MIKIIQNGCNGRMGQVISRLAEADSECEIAAGVDITGEQKNSYPIFTDINECETEADVVIDFSNPASLEKLLEYCVSRKLPVVVATTGLSNKQKNELEEASAHIPVFFSANMSLGINLITELAKKAAKILEGNFDIEIEERHHNQKIDAPSGTALLIADSISEVLNTDCEYVYDRHTSRRKRRNNEIGIHSIRGGTITGEHTVIFAGNDEVIEIKHSASSREVFAVGALKAAKFIAGRQPGMINMSDLIENF